MSVARVHRQHSRANLQLSFRVLDTVAHSALTRAKKSRRCPAALVLRSQLFRGQFFRDQFRGLLERCASSLRASAQLTLFYETLRHAELMHGRFPQPQPLKLAEISLIQPDFVLKLSAGRGVPLSLHGREAMCAGMAVDTQRYRAGKN